jgi:hypothetical protein
MTMTFGQFADGGPVLDPTNHASGPLSKKFAPVTHDQVNEKPLFASDFRPIHYDLYKWLQVIIASMTIFFISLILVSKRFRRRFPSGKASHCLLAGLCLVLIISRMGIIIYLDAFSFFAQARYLFPVYPFLLTLLVLLPGAKTLTAKVSRDEIWS